MTTSATSSISGQAAQQATGGFDAFNGMDLNVFLKLLIAELQNQDPLNPMGNQEILQQVSQIRAIESNQRLSTTLDSVRLGQDLATASAMVGRNIMALSDAGELVTGEVEWVSISPTGPKLHLGDHEIALRNITLILPNDSEWRDGEGPVVIPPEDGSDTGDADDVTPPPADDESNP